MKAVKFLLCMLMLSALLVPMTVSAEELEDNFVDEIGEIDCPYGTPIVDGVIDASEGWSVAQYIDKTNTDGCWGGEEVVITGNIYRAWDEENLYIAADINIPEYTICTGEDDIETDNVVGNRPGWNGDVFVYSVDPMQALLNSGFNNDAAPWYCFGLFEGGEVRTYRTHHNEAEITSEVAGKGAVTETGWRFEVALPWSVVCTDTAEFSFGDAPLTPENTAKEGNMISGAMIYYDRVFDPEQNGMITGSRYVTIAKTLPDGTPGIMCSGWILQAHGMHFVLSGGPAEEDDPVNGAVGGGSNNTGNNDGNENNTNNNNTSTNTNTNNNSTNTNNNNTGNTSKNPSTTKKPATGTSTGSSAAQTGDVSVLISLGVLAASASTLGVVVFRKRK